MKEVNSNQTLSNNSSNINPIEFINSIESINSSQTSLLEDIHKKLRSLFNNKHLITNELAPLTKLLNADSSTKLLEKTSRTALKIESNLKSDITQLEKLSKTKYSLIEREIVALNQFKNSLEEYYHGLRPIVIRGNIKSTIAEYKVNQITKNIIVSIKQLEHSITLANYSKKLISRLLDSIEIKKNISDEQISILRHYSNLSETNLEKNINLISKTKEKLSDTSEILLNLKEQLELEVLQPLQKVIEEKNTFNKNSSKFLSQPGFFSEKQIKLTKSDVIKDMKSIFSEKDLKNYANELSFALNSQILDEEVELFLKSQLQK